MGGCSLFRIFRHAIVFGQQAALYHETIANYLGTVPRLVWWHNLAVLLYPIDVMGDAYVMVISEQIGPLFLMARALLLCLPLPFILEKCSPSGRLNLIVLICFFASLVTFIFSCLLMRDVPRYLAEFTPLAFVLNYCTLVCLWKRFKEESAGRVAFIVLVVLLLVVNTIMGVYLGVNGVLDPI